MEVGTTKVNRKAIWLVQINIKQAELLRWRYISTGTINIYIYIITKKIPILLILQNNLFSMKLAKWTDVDPRLQTLQGQPVTKLETIQICHICSVLYCQNGNRQYHVCMCNKDPLINHAFINWVTRSLSEYINGDKVDVKMCDDSDE